MPARVTTFSAAIRYRNEPETSVPSQPITACSEDPESRTGPASARSPMASRNERANTIVECPSENQKPALSGRRPSLMSLRVVLSMAAM